MSNLRTFLAAGITVQNNESKVRFSQSLDRRIKRYVKLKADRVDIYPLPHAMTKLEALDYLAAMPEFASQSDQEILRLERAYQQKAADRLNSDREPRKRGRPVSGSEKATPSLEEIRARARRSPVSVSDVLAAIAPVSSESAVSADHAEANA